MVKRSISTFKRSTALKLRSTTTEAEKILWLRLRRINIEGSHFRRQVVIGPYIADFACMAERLIIEVDGSQHGEEDARRRDAGRTEWLMSEGYRVIRFWNNEVMNQTDYVMEAIDAAIAVTPPRLRETMQGIVTAGDPPPRGEG